MESHDIAPMVIMLAMCLFGIVALFLRHQRMMAIIQQGRGASLPETQPASVLSEIQQLKELVSDQCLAVEQLRSEVKLSKMPVLEESRAIQA